jgi:hypothetical protein
MKSEFLKNAGGDMTWGKRLIIALGLVLLTQVAHALGIEKFTDSQGTLHITNVGPKKPDSPADQPSPGASSFPRRLRDNTPAPPPASGVVPEVPVPQPEIQPLPEPETQMEPEPGVVPTEPVPVNPQPGAGTIRPEGSGGVTRVALRTRAPEGYKGRERATGGLLNQTTGA